MSEVFLFYLFGGLMVLAGIMMVASRNAVVAACWLIFCFLNAAGIYALLVAPFLAVLQVLVYAGAIMVLFLFVIMMLQSPSLQAEKRAASRWQLPFLLLPLLAVVVCLVIWTRSTPVAPFGEDLPNQFGSVEKVAELLLTKYLLPFELISVVLLVAIIGALTLGKVERKLPWQ